MTISNVAVRSAIGLAVGIGCGCASLGERPFDVDHGPASRVVCDPEQTDPSTVQRADPQPLVRLDQPNLDLGTVPIDTQLAIVARFTNHGDEPAFLRNVYRAGSGTYPLNRRRLEPRSSAEIELGIGTGLRQGRLYDKRFTFVVEGQSPEILRVRFRTELHIVMAPELVAFDSDTSDAAWLTLSSADGRPFRLIGFTDMVHDGIDIGSADAPPTAVHRVRIDRGRWTWSGSPRAIRILTDHPESPVIRVVIRSPQRQRAQDAPNRLADAVSEVPVSEIGAGHEAARRALRRRHEEALRRPQEAHRHDPTILPE